MIHPYWRQAWWAGVALGVALWAELAWADDDDAAADTAPGELAARMAKLETWSLENGLQVAYLGAHEAPVVTVQLWYHAGSKDEPRDRRGSAHMFEHMMFKGTRSVRPEDHARHIDRLGGTVNAFTLQDVTVYHNTLPAQYVDFACRLEAERMRNLLFRADMIAIEREVVKEEIRQSLNQPIARGFFKFLEVAYTKHPYGWTPGGTLEDLDATTPSDLEAFYDTFYVPNNALLVVVGDVTRAQVEACAATWFAPLARGAEPPRPAQAVPEPAQTARRRETADPSQLGLIFAGYHIPAAAHADRYALDVLGLILSQGESSRLHQRLVRKDRVAVAAAGELLLLEDPGLFVLIGVHLDGKQGPAVEAALLDEVRLIQEAPPTAEELTKAKNQLLAKLVFELEDVAGLAQQIGSSWINLRDPGAFLTALERYRAVDGAAVQRVARTYLVEQNLTIVTIPVAGADGGGK
jgi:zinc protease